MILPIVLYGNPVLREVAKPIDKNYPNIKELIENMFETMNKAEGIGLAAPQIGLPIRLFVIDISTLDEDKNPDLKGKPKQAVFINPEIIERSSDIISKEEGCLSLPDIHEKVPRSNKIKIKYLDENFVEKTEEQDGFFGRIIQHEYDHIEGKVFTDNISPLRKQLIKSKLLNLVKRKVKCDYKFK
jgi:peptide deformylase